MFWAIPAASLQKAGWALRFGLHLRSVLPSNKLEVGQAHQQVVGLPSHRYRGKRHFQGSIDYESLFFLVRYSANKAMGIYAATKSRMENQSGEGSIMMFVTPPTKKNSPRAMVQAFMFFFAIDAVTRAPTRVPNA